MSLGSLFAPFTKHKDFGLCETFVGIGKLSLPVYRVQSIIIKSLGESHIGPP